MPTASAQIDIAQIDNSQIDLLVRGIVVTNEHLSTILGFEYDEVTYTATVKDSEGNILPATFLVSLEYEEIEAILVLNQILDGSVYNQSTGLLTLVWHVPSEDPSIYTVRLEWSDQLFLQSLGLII